MNPRSDRLPQKLDGRLGQPRHGLFEAAKVHADLRTRTGRTYWAIIERLLLAHGVHPPESAEIHRPPQRPL